MQKTLFRFVKQAVSIARKLTDAALMQISDPAGNGVAGWKHAVPHFLRQYIKAALQEVFDWAEEMERVRAALVLERGDFPGPSALCKSFDRAPMRIWRELLRLSSELLDHSGHAAIDTTYFDRRQASSNYLSRCNREVQTVQRRSSSTARRARLLTFAVARSGQTGRTSARKSPCETQATCGASPLAKVTTVSFREKLRAEGVRPLIKHRFFEAYDHAHNARIDDDPYNQRSVCETVNSAIKRSNGSGVRARAGYHQFREITLAAAVYNVERALKQ